MQSEAQLKLFEADAGIHQQADVLLYALGEFQHRGHTLCRRELALDRLYGAFKRSVERFGLEMPTDGEIAVQLSALGADVKELPAFAAKRPYRVTIPEELAGKSAEFYHEVQNKQLG